MQLEVVVADAAEAVEAQRAGASRIELVAEMDRGGVTPDRKTVESVARAVSIPVHVMVRPYANGFVYDASARQSILESAARMRDLGAAAIVFGALDDRRRVARQLVEEVLAVSYLPMTFHRAFDFTPVLTAAYATLSNIRGVDRVLSAGGQGTAWEGRESLRELGAGNSLPTVTAAGAIDETNVEQLVRFTRLREVHVMSGARTGGRVDVQKIARLAELMNGVSC
jgi:copper homeostasis protein